MSNTITAYFKGRIGVAESVYQNDSGMVMVFDGIELPAHFDCYFSKLNQEEALPGVGAYDGEDNRVAIPNEVLADPGTVTVHIPLHTGANDSEVEYIVYFKVIGRARPIDDGTPTQMTAIEKALALLSQPITNIEEIVNEALAFTGETFDEMKEDIAEWKSGVESDFENLDAQFQTAIAAVTTDTEVTNIRVGDDNIIYETAGKAVRHQFSNIKTNIDNIRVRTYNLLDMTSADGWYPVSGKDVSVIPLGNSNLRIKSNTSQTYAAARYDIDTTGVTTLYAKRGSTSGTGAMRARIYGISGGTATNLGSISPDGVTFDVSSYDEVCVELCATTTTASTNYIDYEPIIVKAGAEELPFTPYYIYNPQDYETIDFEWQSYSSSTVLNYDNRVKNKPLFASKGSAFIFDPGSDDFRCTYHLYSTYEKAMESFNSPTYIAGDIYASGTLKTNPTREYINSDCWIMVIGYLAGDPNPEISANDVPIGNTLNRLRTDSIVDFENEMGSPQEGIIQGNQLAASKLYNAKFRSKRVTADSRTILSLIHFSDIHGETESLRRIIDFMGAFSDYIDDAICVGDMVKSQTNATAMSFWNSVDGSEKILLTIGNHDVWKEGSETWTTDDYITQAVAYSRYIAPYVSNWDAEYTADQTYYYKDYDDQKIRLICLDMMLFGEERAAELAWLESVLADAITSELSVVIAEHFAPRPNVNFACNFTALDGVASTTEGWSPEVAFLDAVENFKSNDGDFICWIAGHTHCDYICYHPDYPEQLFITVTCSRISESYSDQARIRGTQSQDAFNVISFDAYQNLIKIIRVGANSDAYLRARNSLTINYKTMSIIESD